MVKEGKPEVYFSWLDLIRAAWFFLRGHRTSYVWRMVALGAIYLYAFVPPYIIGQIVDVLTNQPVEIALPAVYRYAFFILITWVIIGVSRLEIKNQLSSIYNDLRYELRVRGFERLVEFALAWHQQENTGNKIQRVETGVQSLRQLLKKGSDKLLTAIIETVGTIIIFSLLGWPFFLFMIVLIGLFVINEVYFYHKIQQANDEFNQANERSTGVYYEGTANLLTVKSLGIKGKVTAQVESAEVASRDHNNIVRSYGIRKWKLIQTIIGLGYFAFIVLIAQQYALGAVTAGLILALFTYFNRLYRLIADTGELTVELIEHKSGIARMMPIFQDEITAIHGTGKFPGQWRTITIEDGGFSYAKDDSTFRIDGLNFAITRNEKVGIVGVSGSGKSTLAKLFMGLYPLQSGKFSVDDKGYYSISHEEITKHISIVLQETELFNLSLLENLTLYKKVSPELLARAIDIAQLAPVIDKLPEGLDALVGERGYLLSGGERQRVGIARAICSGAEILVFDEATSALDSKTEARIQRGLESQLTTKTMIIIAHRLSTLRNVDRIVVFESGHIVEEGTFTSLLKKPRSRFAALYRLQNKRGTRLDR